ncbi:MAG TPA: hypothetical protein VKF42_11260 [Chitinivibrionales bacterium]|nr:hypothetical protein [Chitinivibrionales bacterium]
MNTLSLKPTHKVITAYYTHLRELADLKAVTEGSLAPVFAELLRPVGKECQ